MIIKFGPASLEIRIDNILLDYDINRDIDLSTIRETYNQLIANLSQHHHKQLNYWFLKISERNVLTSDLFLEVCYIVYINRLHHQYGDRLLIITNRPSLYYFFKSKCHSNIKSVLFFQLKHLKNKILFPLKITYFWLTWTYRYVLACYTKRTIYSATEMNGSYLLQTWVNSSNFKNKRYQEGYYGTLANDLARCGKKVFTWPIYYRGTHYFRILKVLRKLRHDFFLQEDILRYHDYLKAIWFTIRARFYFDFRMAILRYREANGAIELDLSALFYYHLNFENVEISALNYFTCYRLKQLGITQLTFIHHFENMNPEKGLVLGVKEFLPNAKTIGYFHTSKPKNLLCLEYASQKELLFAPKPDKIVFNAPAYLSYFKERFPELNVVNGPAYKQAYLSNVLRNPVENNKILVLFSGTEPDISLMINFLKESLDLLTDFEVIIKMHPLKQVYLPNELQHLQIITEPLSDILSKVSKVLATYSASLLEAALYGKIVGFLYNKKSLILNPFDDTGITSYQLITTQADLVEFLQLKPDCIKSNLFNSENNVDAFIGA